MDGRGHHGLRSLSEFFRRVPGIRPLAQLIRPGLARPAGQTGGPEHEAICQDCHDRVAELAAEGLPNPGGLSADALRRAAKRMPTWMK